MHCNMLSPVEHALLQADVSWNRTDAVSCCVPTGASAQKTLPTLTCYSGGKGMAQAVKFTGIKEPLVCVRYQFKCSKGDTGCTPQEQASGVFRWSHTIVGVATCQQMMAYSKMPTPMYKQVLCCTTPLCNRPIDKAIKVTPGVLTMPISG